MIKQAIVMRTDLMMTKGKFVSQGSHASFGAVLQMMNKNDNGLSIEYDDSNSELQHWINNSFTKITLRVDSLDELMRIRDEAERLNMNVCFIIDNGRTQFKNIPTPTCLAIGPHEEEFINLVTGDLKLL